VVRKSADAATGHCSKQSSERLELQLVEPLLLAVQAVLVEPAAP
jgi:hypothetical protein